MSSITNFLCTALDPVSETIVGLDDEPYCSACGCEQIEPIGRLGHLMHFRCMACGWQDSYECHTIDDE